MVKKLLIAFMIGTCLLANGQVNFTANTAGKVPAYNANFYYGTNMGYYGTSWNDAAIADLAAGNPAKGVPGIGSKSLRPTLPEEFITRYGVGIRLNEFAHYQNLGVKDNTTFLNTPASDKYADTNKYGGCNKPSRFWRNMYLPIWDGGLNGTPINDSNFYAAYVYKTVNAYKQYTKFWEIINEPDFDGGGVGWRERGAPLNWWENNPQPCQLNNMRAPIYHYIRLLRISYEVIKTLDPNAFICTGGLGYPSFLDAILRNTDNPVDGSVTPEYPLKGGAWFDVLSFHSYPMYELRVWSNGIGDFVNKRYSDAAVEEYLSLRNNFNTVLNTYGYNGTQFPKKHFICTETNIPEISINNLIGSPEAQCNYVMKVAIESQKADIKQLYLYQLGETVVTSQATNPFNIMGMYNRLEGNGPLANGGNYNVTINQAGYGYKTLSNLLSGYKFDWTATSAMKLTGNLKGGAFKNAQNQILYVLWARTNTDSSEFASGTYSFPAALNIGFVERYDWKFSQNGQKTIISATSIPLNGSPIILKPTTVTATSFEVNHDKGFDLFPNPTNDKVSIVFRNQNAGKAEVQVLDLSGKAILSNPKTCYLENGTQSFEIEGIEHAPKGIYLVKVSSAFGIATKRLVKD